MIDKSLIKIIIVSSLISGAVLGIIPLIPALIWVAFIFLMFFISPFILIYMKKLDLIQDIDIENSLVIGAIAGFSACFGFALIYFPIAFILQLIFKIQSFIWIKVLFVNFGFLIPMIVFTAMLCALFNTFSAFITAYFYSYFNNKGKN